MASIYQELGFLILGSRLRRMSEYFLAEVGQVYKALDMPFEPSWFPLFYILTKENQVSIRQVAESLGTSHSAMSQLVTKLKEKGIITTLHSSEDRRIQLIALTSKGEHLKRRLLPVWDSISQSLQQMKKEAPEVAHFLPALTDLEKHFEQKPLSEIILSQVDREKSIEKQNKPEGVKQRKIAVIKK